MKLNAVIFDLDGTVADTLPLCITAFRKTIEPVLGRGVNDAEIIAPFGRSEAGPLRSFIPRRLDGGQSPYLHHNEALNDVCPRPFPGREELLEHLNSEGNKRAMVTGKGKWNTAITLHRYQPESLFPFRKTGSSEGTNRTAGIRSKLKKLNIPLEAPEQWLFYKPNWLLNRYRISENGSCRFSDKSPKYCKTKL